MPTGDTRAWDFGPVLDLIDSDSTLVESPTRQPRTKFPKDDIADAKQEEDGPGISLGSFAKLWENLGIKFDDSTVSKQNQLASKEYGSARDNLSESVAKHVADNRPSADLELAPASAPESLLDEPRESSSDDPLAGMTKKQRYKVRKKARKAQEAEQPKPKSQAKTNNERDDIKAKPTHPVSTPSAEEPPQGKMAQTETRSQLNVGARTRSTTPPPALTPVPPRTSAVDGTKEPSAQTPSYPQYPLGTERKEQSSGLAKLASASASKQTAQRKGANHIDLAGLDSSRLAQLRTPNHANALSQVQGNPSQNKATRSYPTTPGVNPALAHLNAGLQAQYNAAGTPYALPPGFQAGFQTPPNWPLHKGLVPSSVQPIPIPRVSKASKEAVAPRTREDRDWDFLQQLIQRFPEDKRWLVSPMRLSSDKIGPNGIHIFVDASNILIGFNQTRYNAGLPRCDIAFDSFALLLERRRPVTKRIYSGSTRVSAPIAANEKFIALAGDIGYEQHIFEQVYKVKELTEKQKFFRNVDRFGYSKAMEMQRSDSSGSDSETGTGTSPSKFNFPAAPKWVEQGVDESLHLKMCQSIIDCDEPSTMVLATGDGAEAEYSDGFLKHVERALKKGWKVELVSWKQQTNGGYRNRKFRAKWGDRFRIIELDDFMESLVDDN